MRILVDWLEEFVALPDRVERLAERLTYIGLEVDETRIPAEAMDGLLPAVPRHIQPHETTPELTVCELEADGKSGRVVTAAENLRDERTYVWAPPGARLPDGTVESRRFEGIESEGMLCSLQELGLTETSHRLLELPKSVDLSTPIVELLDLDRPLLELDLTPNRSDCLSHLGVARDFAAAEGLELHSAPPPDLPEEPADDRVIEIEDEDGCWIYVGVPAENITVEPSGLDVQKKLIRLGLSPVNNLVDATNVVLFERGHPLHAFDADRLSFPLTVRSADADETLTTLDGEERELVDHDLVIADERGPRALAGIMGGEATEVGPDTTRTLLEGAYFDPVRVRRTASRLDLSTEASHRFERGTDPDAIETCLARCVELLRKDLGQDADELSVHRPIRVQVRESPVVRIPFSPAGFESLIGYNPGEQVMRERLEKLGCRVDDDADDWNVTVPSWRHDLERPPDLVEEIVRLDGYRNIASDYPSLNLNETPIPNHDRRRSIRAIITDFGFREAITFSFVSPDEHRFVDNGEPRELSNPLSRRQSTMRRSMLDGLLACLGRNLEAGREDVRLFELGRVFPADEEVERERLGFVATGKLYREQWDEHARDLDFFDVKGIIRLLLDRLGYETTTVQPESFPGYRAHRSARIRVRDEAVGRLGEIDITPFDWDSPSPVLGGELELSNLPEAPEPSYRPFSTQPVVKRDLDLVVEGDQHVGPLREAIRDEAKWLESEALFDVYYGDPLPDDKKSVSFRLRFRRAESTLSDREINQVQESVLDRLKEEFGAYLREE